MQHPTCSLAIAILASATQAGTLTVDDDPGAQFSDLPAAVAAAAHGDVILVADGTYSAFDTQKRLSILGRSTAADVHVTGVSTVAATPRIHLAGLRMDALRITDVSGNVVIESCRVGWFGPGSDEDVQTALRVADCDDVLISRTTVSGYPGCCGDSPWGTGQAYGAGSAGLRCEDSDVTVVDSVLVGGAGVSGCFWNTGASGLEVRGGTVVVAGSQLYGGSGGSLQCISHGNGDPGGDGAWVLEGTLILRGGGAFGADDVVAGGYPGDPSQPMGYDLRVEGTGSVFTSGTSWMTSAVDPTATFTSLPIPEPYLEIAGEVASGASLEVRTFAPAGELVVLVSSYRLSPFALPGFDASVWTHPAWISGVAPLSGLGPATAVPLPLVLPPGLGGLAGASVTYQLFAPLMPGTATPGTALAANAATVFAR